MRAGMLGAVLLVTVVACGEGTTQSVSSGRGAAGSPAAGSADALPAVDPGAIATRWRVVKAAPGEFPYKTGEVVEFRTGGGVASGAELVASPGIWALVGNRLELRTPTSLVSYTTSLSGDLLRLRDDSGQTHVLRRFLGPPGPPPAAKSRLEEGQFVSLLAQGRVESAMLTQAGTVIEATGVYHGDSSAQRYAVTFRDCKVVQSLETAFRTNGVLTDGLPPTEVECQA